MGTGRRCWYSEITRSTERQQQLYAPQGVEKGRGNENKSSDGVKNSAVWQAG